MYKKEGMFSNRASLVGDSLLSDCSLHNYMVVNCSHSPTAPENERIGLVHSVLVPVNGIGTRFMCFDGVLFSCISGSLVKRLSKNANCALAHW
jgi:hypothetical protein